MLALEKGIQLALVMRSTDYKTYSVNIVEDTVEREFVAVYGRSDEASW